MLPICPSVPVSKQYGSGVSLSCQLLVSRPPPPAVPGGSGGASSKPTNPTSSCLEGSAVTGAGGPGSPEAESGHGESPRRLPGSPWPEGTRCVRCRQKPRPHRDSPAGAACGPGSRGPCRQSTAGNGVGFGLCREAGTAACWLPEVMTCPPWAGAILRPSPVLGQGASGPHVSALMQVPSGARSSGLWLPDHHRGTDGRCGRSFVLCTLQPAVSEGRGPW